jgi:organic radical activating enzyme
MTLRLYNGTINRRLTKGIRTPKLAIYNLSDFKGEELVTRVLAVIDEHKPLHVSLVGGDPLARYREPEVLLPQIESRGIHVQVVTSAFE